MSLELSQKTAEYCSGCPEKQQREINKKKIFKKAIYLRMPDGMPAKQASNLARIGNWFAFEPSWHFYRTFDHQNQNFCFIFWFFPVFKVLAGNISNCILSWICIVVWHVGKGNLFKIFTEIDKLFTNKIHILWVPADIFVHLCRPTQFVTIVCFARCFAGSAFSWCSQKECVTLCVLNLLFWIFWLSCWCCVRCCFGGKVFF